MWAHSKEIYIPSFISEDISGAISVAYPIELFFWDFLPEKEVFSDTGSDESYKYSEKIKSDATS